MTRRQSAWLAWGLAGANLALIAALIWLARLNHSSLSSFVDENSFAVVFGSVFPVIGALVASRHRRNPSGWLMIGAPLLSLLGRVADAYAHRALVTAPGSLPAGAVASWIAVWSWVPFLSMALLLVMLLPTGRPVSRRWRWLVYAALAEGAFRLVGFMALWPYRGPRLLAFDNDVSWLPLITRMAVMEFPIFAIVALLSFASVVVRFIRSRGEERQQLKWITLGVVILGVEFVISLIASLSTTIDAIAIVPFGVAIAVAILKYRLYEIDVVINRTVVYGILAAFITTVYVGIVVGIGALAGQRSGKPNLGLSILATTVVAVAFGPVKERVQRVANRLVYGKRATPYEAFTELSSRMAGAYATEELLPRMARVLAEATGARRTEAWLHLNGRLRREGSWPETSDRTGPGEVAVGPEGTIPPLPGMSHVTPVVHRGELLGGLALATQGNEPLNPAEAKLVQDLASQAGLVMRNVLLMQDLRASRQRIVAAQDEERRRLERDIHDGAQQDLVTLSLAARMAETQLGPDADPQLHELLSAAGAEIKATLSELRELANGIHPAVLTEQGLGPALRSLAERATVPVEVRVDLDDRLDPTVEATAYFVVSEALANVGKYAEASSVHVTAQRFDGHLRLDVADDGRGGADPAKGSGLRGLQDRVAAVNGSLAVDSPVGAGTRLRVELPCA